MQGHEPAKSGRRGGSEGVEKRRAIRKGNSGQMRHEPVAALEHFQGHAEAGCIVGLPWIVPEEPEPYPGNAKQHQAALLEGSIGAGGRQLGRVARFGNRIGNGFSNGHRGAGMKKGSRSCLDAHG